MKMTILLFSLTLIGALTMCCAETETKTAASDSSQTAPQQEPKKPDLPAPADRKPAEGDDVVVFDTNQGKIVLMFFPDKAPKHVENFKKTVTAKAYDGTKFHRVIPGFMIQGGDPNSKDDDRTNDGMGGYGPAVPAEFNDTPHEKGILSAARTSDPNSATSQFFLCVARVPHLDGQYTVYGKVVEGLDILDKIVNLPRDSRDNPLKANPAIIKSATLQKWPVK